jgi:hypothetical protein
MDREYPEGSRFPASDMSYGIMPADQLKRMADKEYLFFK